MAVAINHNRLVIQPEASHRKHTYNPSSGHSVRRTCSTPTQKLMVSQWRRFRRSNSHPTYGLCTGTWTREVEPCRVVVASVTTRRLHGQLSQPLLQVVAGRSLKCRRPQSIDTPPPSSAKHQGRLTGDIRTPPSRSTSGKSL